MRLPELTGDKGRFSVSSRGGQAPAGDRRYAGKPCIYSRGRQAPAGDRGYAGKPCVSLCLLTGKLTLVQLWDWIQKYPAEMFYTATTSLDSGTPLDHCLQ